MELDKDSKSRRACLRANSEITRALLWAGRSLLILSAVSVLTMPLTQYFWTWDRFLRGGEDFELVSFMVLTVLCLVLVLSQHCKRCVDSLLAQSFVVACKFGRRESTAIRLYRALSVFQTEPATGRSPGIDNTFLLI